MKKESLPTSPLEQAYITLRQRLASLGNNCSVAPDEAEDLLHDGFLRLAQNEIADADEAHGKLWVTVRNLAVDMFRRKKRKANLEDVPASHWHQSEPEGDSCEDIMLMMQHLLTPLQFKIMKMLVADDMDYGVIARRLAMSEGAVRTTVSRARKILREKLRK